LSRIFLAILQKIRNPTLSWLLCVGTSVICYCFDIRVSIFEFSYLILVPMLCVGTLLFGTDTFGRSAPFLVPIHVPVMPALHV